MKKSLVAALLGLAAVSPNAFAQGHVNISNYLVAPYTQIHWDPTTPGVGNQAVNSLEVLLTIWYAPGVVTEASALGLQGVSFTIDPNALFNPGAGHGAGGYYGAQTQVLPDTGVYTFQLRASGVTPAGVIDELQSRSILWQPTGIGSTALPAATDNNSIGLVVVVPEPSTFALMGLGAVGLMLFRRRNA